MPAATADPAPAVLADPRFQRQFEEQGYVVVPLFSVEQAEGLRRDVMTLRGGAPLQPTTAAGAALEYHSSFMDGDQSWRRASFELLAGRMGPAAARFVPDYVPLMGGVLAKPPGAGKVGLHRDWTLLRNAGAVSLNLWCPFLDVDDTNGALRVVPRTQRLFGDIAAPHAPFPWSAFADRLIADSRAVPLRAGEAIVYDDSLLHWSKPNLRETVRLAAGLAFIPRSETPVFYRLDRATGGGRFEMFDMSGGAFLDHEAGAFYSGAIRAPSLGFVDNPNRPVGHEVYRRAKGSAAWRSWRRLRSAFT
jgi:ectoine hydroxylase-related dioxygenase (phytanoyl-CoA dioxygenase family)